jgi:hypothetical protein
MRSTYRELEPSNRGARTKSLQLFQQFRSAPLQFAQIAGRIVHRYFQATAGEGDDAAMLAQGRGQDLLPRVAYRHTSLLNGFQPFGIVAQNISNLDWFSILIGTHPWTAPIQWGNGIVEEWNAGHPTFQHSNTPSFQSIS